MIVEVQPHVEHHEVVAGVVGPYWKAWFRGEWVATEHPGMLAIYPASKLGQGGGGVALFSRAEWARSRLGELWAEEKINDLRWKVDLL